MSGDHPPRFAAVIPASKPFDPARLPAEPGGDLLPAMTRAGRMTLIERLIIRLQLAGATPVIVITGFEHERLERHLARMGVVCLNNPDWDQSSLLDDALRGLRYAEKTCPACDKLLLASPLIHSVRNETLMALLASSKPAALPLYDGQEGLLLVIQRKAMVQIPAGAQGESLADLAAFFGDSVERMPLPDQGILPGQQGSLPMRARLKLSLARESVFFGPGPATLLRLIDETGSVRTACVRMRLSYSKGWQILNLLEEELGAAVVDRKPGGHEGGSSSLTATGRELLHRFEEFSSRTQQCAAHLFEQLFEGFPPPGE